MDEIFDFLYLNVPHLFWIYLAVNIGLGIFNLFMFGSDKISAVDKSAASGRTTVYTLMCLPALGGAWGPLVAMKKWKHKSRKSYFKFAYFSALIVHIIVFAMILIKGV